MTTSFRTVRVFERSGVTAAGRLRIVAAAVCALALAVAGCSQGTSSAPIAVVQEPWSFQGADGVQLTTDHFDLFTTVGDQELVDYLPGFLEATYRQYTDLLPTSAESGDRLQTYVFADQRQWLAFTKATFPDRYDTYSRVRVGGYAQGNMCVAFYINPRVYSLSVIAHEGMHQYFAARFDQRIPAWLNEGLACYCEGFDFKRRAPVFDPQKNSVRRNAVREMLAADALMPLRDMLGTDAGRVIVQSQGQLTRTYYAQAWALVVYLRHGARGRYAKRFEEMLAGVADGSLAQKAQVARITSESPGSVSFGEAVFRAYITDDLDTFEHDLRDYMIKLVGF